MGFILMGANHSIADMVYSILAITKENAILVIISLACTTFGNLIGGNLIPWT
jgi:formate/nitrite transporter FocA (FNT family)